VINQKINNLINNAKNSEGLFTIKVTLDGKEIENVKRKLGIETEFKNYERAKSSVEFYKQIYPDYEFEIEEFSKV